MAVLVLAFYINSREVTQLYAHPNVLWLVCPLFLYWVARIWLLAGRGQVHDDPIVFALKDRTSYVLLALVAAIAVAAT
jgi:4-hydroxybenzoate polyprenyltransferase